VICLLEGNAAADNILQRAAGTRDALAGAKGTAVLKGEGGWTEQAGCPVFTNDDGPRGVQAISDILTSNPKIDAFGIMGGWPLFGAPQPYRQVTDQFKKQIDDKSLVIVAADTIGDELAMAKENRVADLVGQRPFEMGYKAPSVMIDLIQGKKVADPLYTGLDECTPKTLETCIQK
jgi:ribose transport system substrate-binding protein